MEIGWAIFSFVAGTIAGSFANAVAFRYNSGLSVVRGRSVCFSCGKPLGWKELVPIVSFIFQKGRCAGCRSSISVQYPLVEALTGIVFFGICAKLSTLPFSASIAVEAAFQAVAWFCLVVIFVYDLRHKIIPDGFAYAFALIGLVRIFSTYSLESLFVFPDLVFVTLAGVIIAFPFFVLWLVSQGKWIGLGDAKLVLGMGWMLGLSSAISAVLIGFWSGAILSVALIGLSKMPLVVKRLGFAPGRITGKTEIPFAPFLILGYALVYFFELSAIAL